ncbi:hypothetical protein SDC9_201302 [bioreactor metagenome]|uniref:Uncharacterized protein n=1 Tax=bioreactor metagenome TaxID=1076179 RepID=A0A645IQI8_9ZZZZ
MHQARLLQHHLRRHAHQFAIFAQMFRFAGQADHAHNFAFQAQRQVDPLTNAMQMTRNGIIDVHHAALRED